MNPNTNRLEPLAEVGSAQTKELSDHFNQAKALIQQATGSTLVRPNGEPIPTHWSIFTVGETVVVKDYTFRIAYMNEGTIVLEPVSPVVVKGAEP